MSGRGTNKMKKLTFGVAFIAANSLAVFVFASRVEAIEIERPPVQFVDKLGVNMANGQVTNTLNTVSIGGAMGLSHSVSVYANEFNQPDARGFGEKYFNRADNVQLCTTPSACPPFEVMRVQDWSDSQSFQYGGSSPTGYTPISDERHSLEVVGAEFRWTKPDGTVVHFQRPGTGLAATVGGVLTKVVYPNGFTITVAQGSVNTNTGFQLKYQFTGSNPPHNKTEPPNLQAPLYSPTWPLKNPQSIVGINAWKKACPWTTAPCALGTEIWPTATFEWPAGMPRTMHIGWSEVKVTDSANRKTTYRFQADDLSKDEFGVEIPPYNLVEEFSPRLKEIIPPGATATRFTYSYKNLFLPDMNQLDRRLQKSGVIKTAHRLGLGMTYTMNQLQPGSETRNEGGESGGIYEVRQRSLYGNPSGTYYVQTLDGRVWFEQTARNFPSSFDRNTAPSEQYFYETRSNLTKLTRAGQGDTLAEYPAVCTNRKTCNQATRIRDPNGNWTDYAYDPLTGQVTKITYPANQSGIRPETRFGYTVMYATYYNDAQPQVRVQSSEGVSMKTSEEYCINSAASNGNCALGDEVVTTFEYNHPNLLMTGMLVTAPDGSRRTCFKYDDYGNQIEVTTPNANLSSCPGVAP